MPMEAVWKKLNNKKRVKKEFLKYSVTLILLG